MTPKNEFERDFTWLMVATQILLSNTVEEILAEQDFDKAYRSWEVAN